MSSQALAASFYSDGAAKQEARWSALAEDQQVAAICNDISTALTASSCDEVADLWGALNIHYGHGRQKAPSQVQLCLSQYIQRYARGEGPRDKRVSGCANQSRLCELAVDMALELADESSSDAVAGAVLIAMGEEHSFALRLEAVSFLARGRHAPILDHVGAALTNDSGYENTLIRLKAYASEDSLSAAATEALTKAVSDTSVPAQILGGYLQELVQRNEKALGIGMLFVERYPVHSEAILQRLGDVEPEVIKSYEKQLRRVLDDPQYPPRARTAALRCAGHIGVSVSWDTVRSLVKSANRSEAYADVIDYLKNRKAPMTTQEKQELKASITDPAIQESIDRLPGDP